MTRYKDATIQKNIHTHINKNLSPLNGKSVSSNLESKTSACPPYAKVHTYN